MKINRFCLSAVLRDPEKMIFYISSWEFLHFRAFQHFQVTKRPTCDNKSLPILITKSETFDYYAVYVSKVYRICVNFKPLQALKGFEIRRCTQMTSGDGQKILNSAIALVTQLNLPQKVLRGITWERLIAFEVVNIIHLIRFELNAKLIFARKSLAPATRSSRKAKRFAQ